ncbi:MAG: DUF4339 domain-containing protein [Ileibacterium sp.]|nr:DUF4339 domain-containing protein [Ileibacterium sp.]
MKCKNCGFENVETANFCIHCGSPLKEEQQDAVQEKEEAVLEQPAEETVTVMEEAETEPAAMEEAETEPEAELETIEEAQETAAEPETEDVQEEIIETEAVESEEDEGQKWYYVENGASQGPVDQYEIEGMLADGRLTPASYIWTEGLTDWVKVEQSPFAELISAPEDAAPLETIETGPAPDRNKAVESEEWFYVQNNHTSGPFNQEVMKQLILNGTINGDTYVWKEGMTDWDHLRNTPFGASMPKTETAAPSGAQPAPSAYAQGTVKEKSIVLNILLCFLTCGIWYFVWLYQLACDVDTLAAEQNKPKGTDPVLTVILSILSCTIYQLYFFWKDGTVLGSLDYPGYKPENQAALLTILGLLVPVVSFAIMQDQINTIVKYGR